MSFLPYAVAAWIVVIGRYGVVTSRTLIHLVLCLSIMQSASYLVLLSIGYKSHAVAPIFDTVPVGTRAVDPVVQALTLTDVVVGVTVTALLLALAVQAHKRYGTLDPEELRPGSRHG
jgi:multicomponent Na+:H+ antiporter subunit C